jgi:acetyl-CoA carboxylase biotin carboxyl carrier protein
VIDPDELRPDPRPDPIPPPRDPAPPRPSSEDSLLSLIDRLSAILDRSDLQELEVQAGGTALLLRKPIALAPSTALLPATRSGGPPAAVDGRDAPGTTPTGAAESTRRTVKAPLTGLFYTSPAPGSAPYVRIGGEVAVGQVIGLIEAMKLFNEIKSDVAGRVVRIAAESGDLVKAKQTLLEVEPL